MSTNILFSVIGVLLALNVAVGVVAVVKNPEVVPQVAQEVADVAAEVAGEVKDVVQPSSPTTSTDENETEVEGSENEAQTQTQTPPPVSSPTVKTFTLAEVALHKSASDCYTAIRGSVYDLTSFIQRHPGGVDRIMRLCGIEGTDEFMAQHGGDARPESMLASLKIGVVAQ